MLVSEARRRRVVRVAPSPYGAPAPSPHHTTWSSCELPSHALTPPAPTPPASTPSPNEVAIRAVAAHIRAGPHGAASPHVGNTGSLALAEAAAVAAQALRDRLDHSASTTPRAARPTAVLTSPRARSPSLAGTAEFVRSLAGPLGTPLVGWQPSAVWQPTPPSAAPAQPTSTSPPPAPPPHLSPTRMAYSASPRPPSVAFGVATAPAEDSPQSSSPPSRASSTLRVVRERISPRMSHLDGISFDERVHSLQPCRRALSSWRTATFERHVRAMSWRWALNHARRTKCLRAYDQWMTYARARRRSIRARAASKPHPTTHGARVLRTCCGANVSSPVAGEDKVSSLNARTSYGDATGAAPMTLEGLQAAWESAHANVVAERTPHEHALEVLEAQLAAAHAQTEAALAARGADVASARSQASFEGARRGEEVRRARVAADRHMHALEVQLVAAQARASLPDEQLLQSTMPMATSTWPREIGRAALMPASTRSPDADRTDLNCGSTRSHEPDAAGLMRSAAISPSSRGRNAAQPLSPAARREADATHAPPQASASLPMVPRAVPTLAVTPRRAAAQAKAATLSAEEELAAFQQEMEEQMAHQTNRMRRMRSEGTPSRAHRQQQQLELARFDTQMRESIERIQTMRDEVIRRKHAEAHAEAHVGEKAQGEAVVAPPPSPAPAQPAPRENEPQHAASSSCEPVALESLAARRTATVAEEERTRGAAAAERERRMTELIALKKAMAEETAALNRRRDALLHELTVPKEVLDLSGDVEAACAVAARAEIVSAEVSRHPTDPTISAARLATQRAASALAAAAAAGSHVAGNALKQLPTTPSRDASIYVASQIAPDTVPLRTDHWQQSQSAVVVPPSQPAHSQSRYDQSQALEAQLLHVPVGQSQPDHSVHSSAVVTMVTMDGPDLETSSDGHSATVHACTTDVQPPPRLVLLQQDFEVAPPPQLAVPTLPAPMLPASPRPGTMADVYDRCEQVFELLDKNSDGKLSRIEIIQACRKDERVATLLRIPKQIRQEDGSRNAFETMFQSMDGDDSKAVSLDEFQRFWVTDVIPRLGTPTTTAPRTAAKQPPGPPAESMPPSPPYSSRPSSSASELGPPPHVSPPAECASVAELTAQGVTSVASSAAGGASVAVGSSFDGMPSLSPALASTAVSSDGSATTTSTTMASQVTFVRPLTAADTAAVQAAILAHFPGASDAMVNITPGTSAVGVSLTFPAIAQAQANSAQSAVSGASAADLNSQYASQPTSALPAVSMAPRAVTSQMTFASPLTPADVGTIQSAIVSHYPTATVAVDVTPGSSTAGVWLTFPPGTAGDAAAAAASNAINTPNGATSPADPALQSMGGWFAGTSLSLASTSSPTALDASAVAATPGAVTTQNTIASSLGATDSAVVQAAMLAQFPGATTATVDIAPGSTTAGVGLTFPAAQQCAVSAAAASPAINAAEASSAAGGAQSTMGNWCSSTHLSASLQDHTLPVANTPTMLSPIESSDGSTAGAIDTPALPRTTPVPISSENITVDAPWTLAPLEQQLRAAQAATPTATVCDPTVDANGIWTLPLGHENTSPPGVDPTATDAELIAAFATNVAPLHPHSVALAQLVKGHQMLHGPQQLLQALPLVPFSLPPSPPSYGPSPPSSGPSNATSKGTTPPPTGDPSSAVGALGSATSSTTALVSGTPCHIQFTPISAPAPANPSVGPDGIWTLPPVQQQPLASIQPPNAAVSGDGLWTLPAGQRPGGKDARAEDRSNIAQGLCATSTPPPPQQVIQPMTQLPLHAQRENSRPPLALAASSLSSTPVLATPIADTTQSSCSVASPLLTTPRAAPARLVAAPSAIKAISEESEAAELLGADEDDALALLGETPAPKSSTRTINRSSLPAETPRQKLGADALMDLATNDELVEPQVQATTGGDGDDADALELLGVSLPTPQRGGAASILMQLGARAPEALQPGTPIRPNTANQPGIQRLPAPLTQQEETQLPAEVAGDCDAAEVAAQAADFDRPSSISPHRFVQPTPTPAARRTEGAEGFGENASVKDVHEGGAVAIIFDTPPPGTHGASGTPSQEPVSALTPDGMSPEMVTPYGEPQNRLTCLLPSGESPVDKKAGRKGEVSCSPPTPFAVRGTPKSPAGKSTLRSPHIASAGRTPGTQPRQDTPRRVHFSARFSPSSGGAVAEPTRTSRRRSSRASRRTQPSPQPSMSPQVATSHAVESRDVDWPQQGLSFVTDWGTAAQYTVTGGPAVPAAHYQMPTISNCASQYQRTGVEEHARGPVWIPPPGCSHAAVKAVTVPPKTSKRHLRRSRALAPRATRATNAAGSVLALPPRVPLGPSGPLALGASVVELTSRSPIFAQCAELLHRQLHLHGGARGVGLSILRVLQLRNHFTEPVGTLLGRKAPAKGATSPPSLAFVSGDSLAALADFVRAGLRLSAGSPSAASPGDLSISNALTEKSCWGGNARAPTSDPAAEAIPSLSVWRVVLAVCWPGNGTSNATPAFVVDYAIERTDLQLGFENL